MLVKYLTVSNNSDLVISVIEQDLTKGASVTHAIIDHLITSVNSGNDIDQLTLVDQSSAKNIMAYLLIHEPALLISKLTQRYEKTLSHGSEIIGNISSICPLHYLCTNRNCSYHTIKLSDPALLSFMNKNSINYTMSNMVAGELPILLYFLLEDNR